MVRSVTRDSVMDYHEPAPIVLLADSDPAVLEELRAQVASWDCAVQCARNLAQLKGQVAASRADLVVMDLPFGERDSLATLAELLQQPQCPPVVVLTATGSIDTAVQAIKLGASDYVLKPADPERLRQIAAPAIRRHRAKCGADAPGTTSAESEIAQTILGSSLAIRRTRELIADVAVTDAKVLILGESGTGKEVIAQLIHRNSQRSRQKFLKVNCAALPAELLESELFGHRQGAFTGAIKDHPGKFEQADGGTLLLDEIGEIGVQTQAKLLHVLQDGQFTRLGGQACTKVNVRVLAATNIQMENALLEKTFREDLYYRLSVFTVHVPPLRERREEIPYFMEEIVRRAPAEMRSAIGSKLPSRLIDAALLYEWPGNLRELRNFVTRTIIMRDLDAGARELEAKIESGVRKCGVSHLAGKVTNAPGMRTVVRDLKEKTEMAMIQEALEASRWNRRQAAQNLNISYRALLYKIQQHRLAPRTSRNSNEPAVREFPAWRDAE